ncbi:MAG: tRNA (adenosine(37)-N6)-dimethylallyltransferase MiaA [Deltaproteobacteria bacterium CG_4_8_14_3_um_filter_51_11]|nr:tRNA (adenosine(37)-N6)-dimethylallyltransferase MiaA [bacterium]OIP41637.1 MAG: tRNA (adenosine(37)-N6)-dimethylallyltransferase MiaA [Desulfobacteraceae bacterium CG2_30_51_40]PIP45929.1 MAG: tRNA (adenosine(37)-N6)-dimethylallyltransferase MiaA [Deltaproteobacteria bacterium CG23_combo_of_CG06-09_8_20_14_all_51_20]PIX19186.1 MAG: tRNA (adenosine(37)-N6)-dimethylallyltransferase MiaA [Deltaproteobacteria bacterium CG_4_8_14_3_um_filter_51_11]PIY24240.1 MAG: tRNA (adenosine(37)-N6)-dimethyl
MSYEVPKVVVIGGPTGCGKTAFSVMLAEKLDAEILNADSMQVYRGMDIGTAKPTADEKRGITHHLLDIVNPDEAFNAARYRSEALPIIRDIRRRGKVCLVVGGTGLYIKGLLGGLFSAPPADSSLREKLRSEIQDVGPKVLHQRLTMLDPDAAGDIHPNDRVRIVRALELIALTGRRPSELARQHAFGDRDVRGLMLCLERDREDLYERIEKRTDQMIRSGLKEETEGLLRSGYSPQLKPMKALGYRHMKAHLLEGMPLSDAVEQMKRDTRRYAKRQMTWFRSDPSTRWVASGDASRVLTMIEGFLTGQ